MFIRYSMKMLLVLSVFALLGCGGKTSSESSESSSPNTATESSIPSVVSVIPASGMGMSQTFAVTVSDSGGTDQIKAVYVIVNDAPKDGCWFQYFQSENFLTMLNDATPPVWVYSVVGSGKPLSNKFCTLKPAEASVTRDGKQMTLNVPVKFTTALSGMRKVFVVADGRGKQHTEWLPVGTWAVK